MFFLFIVFVLLLVVALRDYDEFYVELHNAALIKSLKSHLCIFIYYVNIYPTNYRLIYACVRVCDET